MSDGVRIERRGAALWVVFDRPQAHNAFDAESLTAFREAAAKAKDERPAALVLRGTGQAFTAGGDLTWFAELVAGDDARSLRSVLTESADTLTALADLPMPVIAAVNGVCVAGGLELVCLSDFVIAARSARFADGHAGVGLVPVAASVTRLVGRVGAINAKRLLLTSAFISADEALAMGLITAVVDDDQVDLEVEALVRQLAEGPPRALALLKHLANIASGDTPTARVAEISAALDHVDSAEAVEGIRAFVTKRRHKCSKGTS